jgi:hypothetical protein
MKRASSVELMVVVVERRLMVDEDEARDARR